MSIKSKASTPTVVSEDKNKSGKIEFLDTFGNVKCYFFKEENWKEAYLLKRKSIHLI